jgi:CheY-like chemotaxis protein
MRPRGRILVVEDNPSNRLLVNDILVYRGHEVILATTAAEARTLLKPPPDLIVMDLQLPGEDAEVLLQEIRSDPELAPLPVIVVTACAMTGDRERLLQAGFDGYMSKPIDTRAFGPLIEKYLENARSRR